MSRRISIQQLLKKRIFIVCVVIILGIVSLGVFGPYFTVDPTDYVGHMYEPPSQEYLLGTDIFGRDIFAQLVYGIRNSMIVGLIAGLISLMLGIVIGGVSGYCVGLVGESLNMIINIFLVIPSIPLLIVLSVLVAQRSVLLVAFFLGAIGGWAGSARAIRAQVMSLREKEFVDLARITGKSTSRIVFGEIFTNMTAFIILQFCGAFAAGMLGEAGMSLIGLGPTNVPTLGMMLHWAIMSLAVQIGIWWWFIPPGIVLLVLTAALFTLQSQMD